MWEFISNALGGDIESLGDFGGFDTETSSDTVSTSPTSTPKQEQVVTKVSSRPIKRQETMQSRKMKIRSEFLNTSMKFTNFDDHFEKLDLIGQGGHGKIYRCRSRDEKDTNKYAVKDIDLNRLKLVPGFDKLKLRREVEILMTVEHPSIVYCHNAFESKSSHFLIVMDYCGGHDLVDILTERKAANQGFTELEAKAILRQLNSALVYLHANHIMHRDLKCDNVRILDTRTISKDFNDLKLIDFGYSKYTATSMASSWAGTPDYMAPEVDDVKSKRGTSYDDSADCWSLGVILYMVLMMDFPRFESCDKKGFLLVKVIPSIWKLLPEDQRRVVPALSATWERLSPNARNLIEGLLQPDPSKRLTAEDVAAHPWLNCAA